MQQSDQSGAANTLLNTITGDSLSYSPQTQTAHGGLQSAMSAKIGDEQITKWGNGAATVHDAKHGTVALENGHLYSMADGDSDRKDLGAATHQSSWDAATQFLGGPSGKANRKLSDLEKTYTKGLDQAPTVRQHAQELGVGNNSAAASQAGGQQDSVSAIVSELMQLLGGSNSR